jgi:3-phenylpropionate/trans-cinnamate dioxygenase ferredoxin subunit
MSYKKISEVENIPINEMRKFSIDEKEVLIANINGKFYAINNRCTHAGGDLSKGKLEGTIVQCPRHGSKFNIQTGEAISGPKILFLKFNTENIKTYEIKKENGNLMIKIDT